MVTAKMPGTPASGNSEAPPPHMPGREVGREPTSEASGAIKAPICPLFISRMKKGARLKRTLMKKNKDYPPKNCTVQEAEKAPGCHRKDVVILP